MKRSSSLLGLFAFCLVAVVLGEGAYFATPVAHQHTKDTGQHDHGSNLEDNRLPSSTASPSAKFNEQKQSNATKHLPAHVLGEKNVSVQTATVAPTSAISNEQKLSQANPKPLSNASRLSPRGLENQNEKIVQPRWSSFVINLDRRPQRLRQFRDALFREEPWLLENGVCRVRGRDGQEMSRNKKKTDGARPVPRHLSSHVPTSLQDVELLVRDGWATDAAIESAESTDSVWPAMSKGGLGLYLAHADAWHKVLDNDLDFGLIFEDDLTLFSPSFEEEVLKIVKKPLNSSASAESWDFLYLQRCNDNRWLKEREDWKVGEADAPQDIGKPVVVHIRSEETVPCTGAYVLTRAGAKKLLTGALPVTRQLDYQLTNVPGLRRAALSPPVAQCSEIVLDSNGKRHRDTDVQQNFERFHHAFQRMDDAANDWLRQWKLSLKNRRTTFLAKHLEVKEIHDCHT